ncbi:hypothetical protein LTR64_006567 [Lithohypha guttulata]|uniref:Uncharacterized protein n=1 Tax=Lithohypha guttulata TaxID=1690604 RepID=A0AAN7YAJ0_9EURO|nr:hypothetical protein LTR51_004875 [Lithohypha guttulata]KAK5091482.1 hypothetical protein LTR05_001666 [Lithohypha guttulata]
MASRILSALALVFLIPQLTTATSFEYFRSVFCDAQSPDFLIESYISPLPLANDKLCHQTPAETMGIKLKDGVKGCVVLAYNDYGCSSLVGSIPSSGKCVASTKARIGSWQAVCNSTIVSADDKATIQTFAPGELKRRGKLRLPAIRDEVNHTSSITLTNENNVATASSIVSEISSGISASATIEVAAGVTSLPSAGAALSSAISSGAGISYNLTSYVTDTATANTSASVTGGGNGTYTPPSMTTALSPTVTATYSGKTNGNGTAQLHMGQASSTFDSSKSLATVYTGLLVVFGFMVML